ncbi:hypothetical protein BaRGS_00033831 [Batillaria attramentaria]|uniref:Mutator-like transposase domain-containing protein n=1 Tax=Batillaria attramentaria TaxID=370345 RepID=A0ABD0JJB0_9CAEN
MKKTIHKAATSVQKISTKSAATAEYDQADQIEDDDKGNIHVSGDGTWMTVGHSSNVGVVATIGMKTGKVLDTQAKSKLCKSCEYWEKQDPHSERYRMWQQEACAVEFTCCRPLLGLSHAHDTLF